MESLKRELGRVETEDGSSQKENYPNSSNLTLEVIRSGLGLQISNPDEHKEPHGLESTLKPLFVHCQELLEFVQLLDAESQDLVRECTEKRQVVQQFEALYDSLREREVQFYDKMMGQQQRFTMLFSKFGSLKKKVSIHLKELQDERDVLASDAFALETKIAEVETACTSLKRRIDAQRDVIQSLRKGSQNMPSEKEIMDLNLKVRSLQNRNAQLLTDRTVLRLNLEEFLSSLDRVVDACLNEQCIGDVMAAPFTRCDPTYTLPDRILVDKSEKMGGNFNDHSSQEATVLLGSYTCSADSLEKRVEHLRNSIALQHQEYEQKLGTLQQERDVYDRYRDALEKMLDQDPLSE